MSDSSVASRVVTVELDPGVYRLDAIKKAAYRLGGRASVEISCAPGSTVRVTLHPKPGGSEDLERLAAELRNEVLDQELREVVGRETEAVRNLILAQAFSKTSLLDPVGEAADFREDPLGAGRADP